MAGQAHRGATADKYLAGGGHFLPEKQADQGGCACARGSGQKHELAKIHLQVDIRQGDDAVFIDLAQVDGFD